MTTEIKNVRRCTECNKIIVDAKHKACPACNSEKLEAVDMNDPDAKLKHRFEARGLGRAPFTFIGIEERRGPLHLGGGCYVGSPGQPMGTCDHCGTGIAECCIIRDADGKTFVVGNVCVGYTNDYKLTSRVKAAVNALKREKKLTRDTALVTEARQLLKDEAVRAKLATVAHPNSFYAAQGRTYLDYADYLMSGEGFFNLTSKVRISKEIKAAAPVAEVA